MYMSVVFDNVAQVTAEDCADVTNLTTANSALTEQVVLYTNRLSTKEVGNMALQTAMRNLQRELKNLRAEIYNLNKSGHSGGADAAYKENGRMVPRWENKDSPTTPPGGAPHTVRAMGRAAIQDQSARKRGQATRLMPQQQQDWEAVLSAYHRASSG